MDATTAGLVGVVVGGVLAGILTVINAFLSRRNLRDMLSTEREERRLADLRAWRDRSTPALVQVRNLLATYHPGFPKAVAVESRHFDAEARTGYNERIAREVDERSRAISDMLTEISAAHPSQNVRDLAEEVRTLVLRHCSEMRDSLLHGGKGYDFRPDHDRAREVLVELTNALHSNSSTSQADALSVLLDR